MLRPFLKETGFHSSKVSFVPVAAFAGVNLVELRSPEGDPLRRWYSGPTLAALLGTCIVSPIEYQILTCLFLRQTRPTNTYHRDAVALPHRKCVQRADCDVIWYWCVRQSSVRGRSSRREATDCPRRRDSGGPV